jgi:hypothetical protein
LLSGLLPDRIPAQEDGLRRRAMFVNKAADGLEIKILKRTESEFELVAPSHEFKAGDKIRIHFRRNFDGHVYFVNVAPSGETRIVHHSQVKADIENQLPAAPDAILFDKEEGVEVLKVVLAREAIAVFEDAIKTANGLLGKSPASIAPERTRSLLPPAGKKIEPNGIAPPNNDADARCRGLKLATGDKFRCRGLVLASGNAQKNQGTIAIPIADDPKDSGGKLKSGDVVVIDLHLKHVQ